MSTRNGLLLKFGSGLAVRQITAEISAAGDRLPAASDRESNAGGGRAVNGFTLLEVMVAMAIMAIVLVSVYRLHSQTLSMNAAARFYTQAPLLAQSRLAQLESDPSEIITGDSGDFGESFPGFSWSVSTDEMSSETLGEVAANFKRIDIKISYNDSEYVYDFRTYRYMAE